MKEVPTLTTSPRVGGQGGRGGRPVDAIYWCPDSCSMKRTPALTASCSVAKTCGGPPLPVLIGPRHSSVAWEPALGSSSMSKKTKQTKPLVLTKPACLRVVRGEFVDLEPSLLVMNEHQGGPQWRVFKRSSRLRLDLESSQRRCTELRWRGRSRRDGDIRKATVRRRPGQVSASLGFRSGRSDRAPRPKTLRRPLGMRTAGRSPQNKR